MKNVEVESNGVVEISGDSATVTFERHYNRPRSVVWQALTAPAELAQWLDETVVDLREGGRFEIHFSDAPMLGSITALEDGNVLAYSWHAGRDNESHVRFELSDEGEGTLLRLVHTKLRRESAAGFAAGWHHHLERLSAVLTGADTSWSDDRFSELRAEYEAASAGAWLRLLATDQQTFLAGAQDQVAAVDRLGQRTVGHGDARPVN